MDRDGIFAGDDPFEIARAWLAEAGATEPSDPNAIALATADAEGRPDVRVVLLKEIEATGAGNGAFVFYTNYESAKGVQLAENPEAAFVMHWKSLGRQIRVRGSVEREDGPQADAYYAGRSLRSRHGAWASEQSRPLADRDALMAQVADASAREGTNPARPPFWGGFRITPRQMEFWADGPYRLHDRFRWDRVEDGSWSVSRLNP